jgi:hypothetical protein
MAERLLIAVGGVATSADAVPSGVRTLIDAADEILVISPTLPSRLQWLVSDTDAARTRADERLRVVLGQVDDVGAAARGQVGSDDPLTPFEDAAREHQPTHIVSSRCDRRNEPAGKSAA